MDWTIDPEEAMKGDAARAQGAAAAEHPARGQVRQQARDLLKTLASLETEACRRIALEQALERAVMVGYRAASRGPCGPVTLTEVTEAAARIVGRHVGLMVAFEAGARWMERRQRSQTK